MKLLIQKRSEVLSTATQGIVFETTLLLPGATTTCTTECCCCCTSGMTAGLAETQAEEA